MNPHPANEAKESLLISIVDDEACVRESLSSLVRSVGYKAKEYASAEDFLTWGWWDEPACLILDVRLPAMGGLELQRFLHATQSGRPIILISGHASENEETWATMRGAIAFLRKPFSDEALLSAVGKAIARNGRPDADPATPGDQVCPLCHQTTRVEEIPGRLVLDHVDLRAAAVEAIKKRNPRWSEQDGLCADCWTLYVGLGRGISSSRSPDSPPKANPQGDRKSNPTAGLRPKG